MKRQKKSDEEQGEKKQPIIVHVWNTGRYQGVASTYHEAFSRWSTWSAVEKLQARQQARQNVRMH